MDKTPAYLEIKKSKFYSYAFDIKNKDDLVAILEDLRKEYKKATHICYAYVYIENGVINSGANDDGEPKGTAGKPIREVMMLKKIENKAVFVVRFFGGKELGASGLVKAYRKCATLALS
ncbi:YigZ family protein [Mycoplasmopsis iners]|uniref:YigZ family protein n=1 Tax=Mycoplasmopsis iners TaxID=76630 RepID=UPI0004976D32|nr:YigZ family protein [Mycoplasmopsis iners]